MNCKLLKTTTILCSLLPGILLAESRTTQGGGNITYDSTSATLSTSNGGKVTASDTNNIKHYTATGILGATASKDVYENGDSMSSATGNRGGTASNSSGEGI
jgi:hypothetical protein